MAIAIVWAAIGGALALLVADAGTAIGIGVACAVLSLIIPPGAQIGAAMVLVGHPGLIGPVIVGGEVLCALGLAGLYAWHVRLSHA